MGAWGKALVLALFLFLVPESPVSGEEHCIRLKDQSLIYDPKELPICPPLLSQIIPSTIGRPQNFLAVELASCAGMIDAAIVVAPENKINPNFVDGDVYFQAAKSQRERPSLDELQEWRLSSLKANLDIFSDPVMSRSSGVTHGFVKCSTAYFGATEN